MLLIGTVCYFGLIFKIKLYEISIKKTENVKIIEDFFKKKPTPRQAESGIFFVRRK